MTTETWKPIPSLDNRYGASTLGRVRGPFGRVLKARPTNSGYLLVSPMLRGVKVARTVHRLVAEVFCEGYAPGLEVNHLNLDKWDNTPGNLEWSTRTQNVKHAVEAGVMFTPRFCVIGVPLAGGAPVAFSSQSAAEKYFSGKNSSAVHHCLVGKKKSAYGHTWSRA